jgi:putative nucleotidyltransferase with HDIG domain
METIHLDEKNSNSADNSSTFEDKQSMFQEIGIHLLEDEHPSIYLNELSSNILFQQYPFSMIKRLEKAEQSPIHHPEGSAWNHTMLVVDEAANKKSKSKNPTIFMWAALLHDIGKPDTTRNRKGKITSYEHDSVGAVLAKEFLEYFSCNTEFTLQVVNLVRYHMHILYVLKDLPFGNIKEMKNRVDIHELALLGFCDRLGRVGKNVKEEEDNIALFLEKSKKTERLGKNHGKK